MLSFKVTSIGSSSGIIVTKVARARLRVKKGDTLYLTEALHGAWRMTPYNAELTSEMKLAEEIMHEDREVLRALAK